MPEYATEWFCSKCNGTGTVESGHGNYTCDKCKGAGKGLSETFSKDFIDFFADLRDKIDEILEKVSE